MPLEQIDELTGLVSWTDPNELPKRGNDRKKFVAKDCTMINCTKIARKRIRRLAQLRGVGVIEYLERIIDEEEARVRNEILAAFERKKASIEMDSNPGTTSASEVPVGQAGVAE